MQPPNGIQWNATQDESYIYRSAEGTRPMGCFVTYNTGWPTVLVLLRCITCVCGNFALCAGSRSLVLGMCCLFPDGDSIAESQCVASSSAQGSTMPRTRTAAVSHFKALHQTKSKDEGLCISHTDTNGTPEFNRVDLGEGVRLHNLGGLSPWC